MEILCQPLLGLWTRFGRYTATKLHHWSKRTVLPDDGINMQRESILTLASLERERKLWHHGLPEDGADALASPLSVILNLAIGQENVKWKRRRWPLPSYAMKAFRYLRTIFREKSSSLYTSIAVVHCIHQWPTACVKHCSVNMFAVDTVLYLGDSTVLTLSKGEQGALFSCQFFQGANPRVDVIICGFSSLLGLSFASTGLFFLYFGFPFSLKTKTFKFQKICNARTRFNEFLQELLSAP